jgi:CBS domain-containing protein
MELADLMNTNVLSVPPDTTLAEAAHRMVDHDTGAACVTEGDQLIGVISERDLLRVLARGFDPDLTVRDRMIANVLTASSATGLPEAMAIMVDGHFRHLPVVDHGRVIGMVSMRDLMAWAALRLRHGTGDHEDDPVDTAELVATINRMRTGAG